MKIAALALLTADLDRYHWPWIWMPLTSTFMNTPLPWADEAWVNPWPGLEEKHLRPWWSGAESSGSQLPQGPELTLLGTGSLGSSDLHPFEFEYLKDASACDDGVSCAADGLIGSFAVTDDKLGSLKASDASAANLALSPATLPDNAGNTLAAARSIGSLGATQSFRDWVGSSDTNDYYRFTVSQASSFSLNLNGLSADADVQLLSASGSVLASSANGGTTPDTISRALATGTYFVRVYPYTGSTNYTLSVSATPSTPPDNAGNTLAAARSIGSLGATQSFSDWVGSSDTNDYYRFTVSQASSFSLNLNGLSADADVQLLSDSGLVLASSANTGSSSEAISRALATGTYFVRVYPYTGSTTYTLSLSATPSTSPPSGGYSTISGYGEASVERAIERLLSISIPDLPNQFTGGLYGLDRIGAPEAWSRGYMGQGIVVAVCDTGVDRMHPDLDGNIWTNSREIAGNGVDDDGNGYVDDVYGWNFASNNNNTLDVQGHGTHVSGTIAGENNGFGVTGVAYGARIMPVKVLGDNGSGTLQGVANGIRYAANNGANVINLSLGSSAGDPILQSAVEYAWSRGVAVIMAAGNSSGSSPGYPAAYANRWGIAVGAVDSAGAMASFSNRAGSTVLDYVTAAGVNVYSTLPNNRYASFNGTSMATPHMAGAMALLIQANRASGRNLSLTQLEQLFMSTASNSVAAGATIAAGGSGPSGFLAAATDQGGTPAAPPAPAAYQPAGNSTSSTTTNNNSSSTTTTNIAAATPITSASPESDTSASGLISDAPAESVPTQGPAGSKTAWSSPTQVATTTFLALSSRSRAHGLLDPLTGLLPTNMRGA